MQLERAESLPDRAPDASFALHDGVFRLEDWLPYEFSYIANRVSETLYRFYHARFGLSVTGWRIVVVLASQAPLSAKELAARTAMNQVNISREVSQLARLGMVSRKVDAQDRRCVTLKLTRKGMSAYEQVLPLAIALERELLAPLGREAVASLRQSLATIARRAGTELAPDGPFQSRHTARGR